MPKTIAESIKPSPSYLRILFFISGIVATVAYRILLLLDGIWVPVVWYVGTIGFIIYFGHRWQVESRRAKLVEDHGLLDVIEQSSATEEKKSALRYLVRTSLTSKVRYNSAFIFFASVVALIADIALTLLDAHP